MKNKKIDRQRIFYIVCLFFLLGTIGGAAAANFLPADELNNLVLFLQQAEERQGQPSYGAIFWKYLKYGLLIWVGGWMQNGIFLSGAAFLFRSVSIGFASAMLFLAYGGRGIALALFSVLPQNLVLIPTYIFLMWMALYYMLRWRETDGKYGLKREKRKKQVEYSILFSGAAVLLAGGAGVEYFFLI